MDNCCYNRVFDDRTIIKNYLEREAILILFQKIEDGELTLIGSDVLRIEMEQTPDCQKAQWVKEIYQRTVSKEVALTDKIKNRAKEIQGISNIKSFDSLHLASAEQNADILLTTDSKFLNAAKRLSRLDIRIENPIYFVSEVVKND